MPAKKRTRVTRTATKDAYPQFITGTSGATGAVDDYRVGAISLPISKTPVQSGRAQVLEILKVFWYIGIENHADAAGEMFAFLSTAQHRDSGNTSTRATLAADLEDPFTFAIALRQVNLTTSGAMAFDEPIVIDCTDGNGNGILIAADRLYVHHGDISGSTASRSVCKILYRITTVPMIEYLGIVQSQNTRYIPTS